MCHKVEIDRSQAGWSLVELLVVIVVIAVVASLTILQRGSANEQFQRQNAARDLKTAFERARFDSVKRRSDGSTGAPFATVSITSNSFTLRTFDLDINGVPVPRDQISPVASGIVISEYSAPITSTKEVAFNRRGEVSVTGGGSPYFKVCNGVCPEGAGNAATTNTVLVTPTGTVNLLAGGVEIPNFSNPSVTSVSATAGVKPDLVLP